MTPNRWRGRRGYVELGPTEHRVARYLDVLTRSGRVTIRTVDLAARLGLERSEAYRVTRQLRVLGLFGIENDRTGQLGGRRYWRTAIEHDGARLDPTRHRDAIARLRGWTAAVRRRALDHIRRRSGTAPAVQPARRSPQASGLSFRELFAATPEGAALLRSWRVT